ncbi:NAD(P)H-hydrate dehydratase [Ancylothrix sp. C2]|uniref:NAD(P)H-hydrate dehydratase n=1 Tax=Ancylothrix sp. D3o TaxID=2953691 RepID=UPI0021BB7D20|nr:NAD(P)H-hydrate dehydratase [Ancylothrix sp. D3o]MCT7951918.1 NAD(P)H-hydrate dehydratase [Ancylothrix sp. D3o]
MKHRHNLIEEFAVTAEQMRAIEGRIFDAGMPVAALMEKVAGLIAGRIEQVLTDVGAGSSPFLPPINIINKPSPSIPNQGETPRELVGQKWGEYKIGVLAGPGHNGGDALVVARELYFRGYQIVIYSPFEKVKELTGFHARYCASLGIPFFQKISDIKDCDLFIDGLFGFGLERRLEGETAEEIEEINAWKKPIFSIDLPSGLHTDSGEVLGSAIRANRTFCLGLWKLAFLQDPALEYIGIAELIDFDIPLADIWAVLGNPPNIRKITSDEAVSRLPMPRTPTSHKYKNGHLLLIAGSEKYTGAVILAGLAARASGVGMLSILVPKSLKLMLSPLLPEALIIGCPETESGALSCLPVGVELSSYDAIACGPGLTLAAAPVVETVLGSDRPLILDADGLNVLANLGLSRVNERQALTVLTPHGGEFKRLFPELTEDLTKNRVYATQKAAAVCGGVVLLKGARTVIAYPDNRVWINPESTAALGRGGSGDVLTGLMGGLMAQAQAQEKPVEDCVPVATWWHSQAAIMAAKERSELGVDAFTLTQYLSLVCAQMTNGY